MEEIKDLRELSAPHAMSRDEVISALSSSASGLSSEMAVARLSQFGINALDEEMRKNLLQRILGQIGDPMVLVLIAAALLSGLLGEIADMIIILAVVVVNTIIGLAQENKAEHALEALKRMGAQTAKVYRDGRMDMVEAALLVPGDVIALEAGDMVPADARLMESSNLKIEEASLTGESLPSEKESGALLKADTAVGDRVNMAFSGTGVTYGRATAIVCATGMNTEVGKIAGMLRDTKEESTPLQRQIAGIGRLLTWAVLGICALIFVVLILKAGNISLGTALDAFMVSVSLAVAAIPEGLPAVVTIVMALGVSRMAQQKAIIKKLPAVETLGCAQIICSDKTGTLTQNKMDVRKLYCDGILYEAGAFPAPGGLLVDILFHCNDAQIAADGREIGDPTETCLKRYAAERCGIQRLEGSARVADLPFDSERKMMTTLHRSDGGFVAYTKGAPDEVLKRCVSVSIEGSAVPLTDALQASILAANHDMAQQALRVLGAAYKPQSGEGIEEKDMIFVGLVGMMDPPRPEVYEAVRKCKTAGITTVMITGDHKDTAVAIAAMLGIIDDPSQAVFGAEIDGLSEEELDRRIAGIRVYARVSPQHKVRIIEAWKRRGKIVAMTGDGVNDAPALKRADIGVGMGITGTDVSKGVSDMLLADDNFATIVGAVEEGRKIYTNIRKAVQFLLSSNLSEVLSLFVATLILPAGTVFLGAVHILWINLVTDTLPAIGLGMNNSEEGAMSQPPRDARASIFSGGVGLSILYQGALMALLTLGSYFIGLRASGAVATTMAFVTLSTVQIFHSFNIKVGRDSIFSKSTFDNRMLLLGGLLPVILMAIILYIPPIAGVFKVVSLGASQIGVALATALAVIPIDEAIRFIKRRRRTKLNES